MKSHLLMSQESSIRQPLQRNIPSNSPPYRYQVYGLTVHSEILLPQLVSRTENDLADIVVRYGNVPKSLDNPTDQGRDWEISSRQFLLKIDGVAKYWANGLEEVWIDRDSHASDDDVRLFLLGSTLGFLLHLRHILPLHASAIRTERGAVLFTGVSGAGKSTTLSAMVQRGYAMLADDVSGIVMDKNGYPLVLPAFPSSRLFADSAAKLNRSTKGLSQVKTSLNKYLFPVDNFCREPIPLDAVYILTNHQRPEIELQPVKQNTHKLAYFLVNTYRKQFVKAVGWEQEQFKLISQIIHQTKVIKVTRPTQGFLLDELIERLEQDFRSKS